MSRSESAPPTGVYLITNTVNGKVYVGSTGVGLGVRLKGHRRALNGGYHINKHLQAAWAKYGSKAFRFKILEECRPDACVVREQFWIDHYESYKPGRGYNINPKAASSLGVKRTKETRAKLSEIARRVQKIVRQRERETGIVRNTGRGFTHTAEVRSRLSEAKKKYWADWRASGKTVSEVTRARLGAASKKAWAEARAAGRAKRGVETKAKLSAAMKACWERKRAAGVVLGHTPSKETRAKIAASLAGRTIPPNVRAKISNTLRSQRSGNNALLRPAPRSTAGVI